MYPLGPDVLGDPYSVSHRIEVCEAAKSSSSRDTKNGIGGSRGRASLVIKRREALNTSSRPRLQSKKNLLFLAFPSLGAHV